MLAFDSHAFVKDMRSVGFTEDQAEALSKAQVSLLEERLATKQDLDLLRRDLKAEVKADLAEVRGEIADVRVEMKAMEARITKWTVGLFLTQTAVVAALIKFL